MKKVKSMGPLVLGIGIAGVSYLSSKENRDKVKHVYFKVKDKIVDIWCKHDPSNCDELIEKAGNPDPYDIEDNKMVDEGALYSVKYYNKELQQ